MRATETLFHEHEVIEAVLDCLEAATHAIEAGEAPCTRTFTEAIEFIRGYADGVHHQKEEDELFPILEERGVACEGGPIGVMLAEHDEGRQLVGEMQEALDAVETKGDAGPLVGFTRSFISLLREHIEKENEVLFPMADGALQPQDQEDLASAFQTADEGGGIIDRFLQMAHDLCHRWDVKFPGPLPAERT